jgi:hypothetical protein
MSNRDLTVEELQSLVTRLTAPAEGFVPIICSAVLVATGAVDVENHKWEHDVWRATVSRGDKSLSFDYRTGTGFRRVPKGPWGNEQRFTTEAKSRPWTKADRGHRKAVPCVPSAYDILGRLMADTYCAGLNFVDWCDEYGYDTDSRKAVDIHETCARMARDARRVLGDLYSDLDGISF